MEHSTWQQHTKIVPLRMSSHDFLWHFINFNLTERQTRDFPQPFQFRRAKNNCQNFSIGWSEIGCWLFKLHLQTLLSSFNRIKYHRIQSKRSYKHFIDSIYVLVTFSLVAVIFVRNYIHSTDSWFYLFTFIIILTSTCCDCQQQISVEMGIHKCVLL